MRRILNGSFLLAILISFLLLSCKHKSKEAAVLIDGAKYTCSMHPQVIKDRPGSCPICGMDLILLHPAHPQESADTSLAALVKPADEIVISNIRTVKPETGSRVEESNVKGIINYNTAMQNSISARISGRIERLYVKYNYQSVSRGQKLLDIYSPDLANAQQELLFLKNNNEPGLVEGAKRKLRLLGASEQQINQVLKSGRVNYSVSIYSPYSGYVSENQGNGSTATDRSAAGSTIISSQSSMDGMASSAPSSGPVSNATAPIPDISSVSPLQLRGGQYVSAGQKLFNLVNSNSVWAEFYVTPAELDKYKRGTIVQVQSVDIKNKRDRVAVSLIQPYYSEGINYSLVRAVLSNSDQSWKIGELISVSSESSQRTGTWVPRTSVIQLGTRYVSFIKDKSAFIPVYVKVNTILGDWIDIGKSINPDQEIAENAWFLVDSESFIKAKEITAR